MTHFLICTNLIVSIVHRQLSPQGQMGEAGKGQGVKGEKEGQYFLK